MNEEDRDNVRIDLLKFRRKAYLSYPIGSPERKTFLRTILQNELRLTKNEMPQYLIDSVIEGEEHVQSDALKSIIFFFFVFFLNTAIFSKTFPNNHYFSLVFLFLGVM